jgi:hypothetical protein
VYAVLEGVSVTGLKITSKEEHENDEIGRRVWVQSSREMWDDGWGVEGPGERGE